MNSVSIPLALLLVMVHYTLTFINLFIVLEALCQRTNATFFVNELLELCTIAYAIYEYNKFVLAVWIELNIM